MRFKNARFHFIGVGGIGMCGLAQLLHNMGAVVSGSDLASNQQTQALSDLGVKIFKGHSKENISGVEVVVYSSAVKSENVEMQEAHRQRVPIISRAEALAEIMRLKRGVAIGGTHGKTTTTSITASIFLEAKSDPTIVVGGRLQQIQSTAMLGKGEWLLAEADESDGSFNKLSPEVVVITNIDNDHLDHFGSFKNLQQGFLGFAGLIPFYGKAIVFGDDPETKKLFKDFRKPILFYGFGEDNDFVLHGDPGNYEILKSKKVLGAIQPQFPGRHNALNSLAALAVGLEAGFSFDVCKRGIEKFTGVDRRFQFKGKKRDITVYDDYGHHPTEIKAVTQAFKEKFPHKRLVVYFQPHRFSRTETCWEQFTESFSLADHVWITNIYPAGEKPIAGITAERLALAIKNRNCQFLSSENIDVTVSEIAKFLKPNDIFVTLGAGDGWKVGVKLFETL
ncbi:MAG: UDP-N-acetylmuramate--L-alanine ligase [Pseudomonadota bacterium]|nr:UDP-N-acetylmuramate--L-alanine ligase [Pseudomonadota bacterium]